MRRFRGTATAVAVSLAASLLAACGGSQTTASTESPTVASVSASAQSSATVTSSGLRRSQRADEPRVRKGPAPLPGGARGAPTPTRARPDTPAAPPNSPANCNGSRWPAAMRHAPGRPARPAHRPSPALPGRSPCAGRCWDRRSTPPSSPRGARVGARLPPRRAAMANTNAWHLAMAAEQVNQQATLAEILTQAVANADAQAHRAEIPGCGLLVLAG